VTSTRSRDPLRARLSELTLQDEYRFGRRLNRLKGGDQKGRERLEQDVARAVERVEKRKAAVPHITYPDTLPVSARRDDLLAAIRDNQVVVVAGETGSGKTTQLPKICLELGRGVRGTIAHTQPRRLAARTVAERIADELKVSLGEAVGYAVRFSDQSRADTLLRLMTDGLLLAEIQRDRLLRRYDTIIVDEAHERSLNIDFLLGCIKRILPQRPELKGTGMLGAASLNGCTIAGEIRWNRFTSPQATRQPPKSFSSRSIAAANAASCCWPLIRSSRS